MATEREAGTIQSLSRILARAPCLRPTEEGGFAHDVWTVPSSPDRRAARHRSRVGRPRSGYAHAVHGCRGEPGRYPGYRRRVPRSAGQSRQRQSGPAGHGSSRDQLGRGRSDERHGRGDAVHRLSEHARGDLHHAGGWSHPDAHHWRGRGHRAEHRRQSVQSCRLQPDLWDRVQDLQPCAPLRADRQQHHRRHLLDTGNGRERACRPERVRRGLH